MLSDTDELRHLAMVVMDNQVPGCFLTDFVRRLQRSAGEESSAATRRAVQQISDRRPGLTPAEAAAELLRRADESDQSRGVSCA